MSRPWCRVLPGRAAPPWLACPHMQAPPLDFQSGRVVGGALEPSLPGETSPIGEPQGRGIPPAREPQLQTSLLWAEGGAGPGPYPRSVDSPEHILLLPPNPRLRFQDIEGQGCPQDPWGVFCFAGGECLGGGCLRDSIIHQLQHLVSGYQFQQASPDSQVWNWAGLGWGSSPGGLGPGPQASSLLQRGVENPRAVRPFASPGTGARGSFPLLALPLLLHSGPGAAGPLLSNEQSPRWSTQVAA
jgi:hypothetical protein